MDTAYYKNYLGLALPDDEMRRIASPKLELGFHITAKFFETGVVIGTLAPLVLYGLVRRNELSVIQRCVTSGGVRGGLFGLIAGPSVAYAFIQKKNLSDDDCFDRCYRLRYNFNQVRADRSFDMGLVTGALVFAPAGQMLFGAFLFSTCFIIATGIMNTMGVFKEKK